MFHTLLLAALTTPAALPPVATFTPHRPATTVAEAISWSTSGYSRSLRAAKKNDTLVFLAFVPETSEYSNKVVAETFPNAAVADSLSDLICLQFTELEDSRFEMVREKYNVETYPTFVFANADGSIEDRIEGFIPPEPMLQQLQRIKAGDGTVSWHRAKVAEEPDELEHVYSLAQMLEGVRDDDAAEVAYASIREADPHGESTAGARLALQVVWEQVKAAANGDRASWDLRPVHHHLAAVSNHTAAFQGWTEVGNFHAQLPDQVSQAGDAFQRAWEHAPDVARDNWAAGVADYLVSYGGESLPENLQVFALELAQTSVEKARHAREELLAGDGPGDAKADGDRDGADGDDGGDGDGGNADAFVAGRLAILAKCQQTFGLTEDAVSSARRCTELDPENEEYAERLAALVAQS